MQVDVQVVEGPRQNSRNSLLVHFDKDGRGAPSPLVVSFLWGHEVRLICASETREHEKVLEVQRSFLSKLAVERMHLGWWEGWSWPTEICYSYLIDLHSLEGRGR